MTGIAMLLLIAAAAYALRRSLHIPLIPILMLGGMGMRALDLGFDDQMARDGMDIGLAIMVFGAGMELNPKRFGAQRGLVIGIGLAQFFLIGLGGFLVIWLFRGGLLPALYVGLAISTSSTLIIIRLLKERQQMFEPFGRVVTGVLLLQDLLIILLIVLLARLPEGVDAVLHGLGGLTILLGLCATGLKFVMPFLVLRMILDHETLGLTILSVLFLFMGLTYALGLPLITGAFLAGVSLSAFPVNSVARGLVQSLTGFFMAVFFTLLGSLVDWPDAAGWLLVAGLTILIFILTPLVVILLAQRMGLNARSSIEGGLLLAMTSEFSLVVALQGLLIGQLSLELFHVLAWVTMLTMTLTPLWATDRTTWWLMKRYRRSAPTGKAAWKDLENHVIMLGFGKGSSVVQKLLAQAGYEVLIVNDDPVIAQELQAQGLQTLYGDGSDPRVLELINASEARLIISSMRRVNDTEKILKWLGPKAPDLIIRVFEPGDAEQIRRFGGIPVLSSEAAAEAFMEWWKRVEPHLGLTK